MKRPLNVVLYDAGSLSGETLMTLLDERGFPVETLCAIADTADSEQTVTFQDQDIEVTSAEAINWNEADVLFLPAGCRANEALVKQATQSDCLVIDGRLGSQSGPLLFPDAPVESTELVRTDRVAVVPTSPAALMLPVLKPLEDAFGIDSVSVTVCQSVSGAGQSGIDTLRKQTIELLNGKPVSGGRLAFNVLPQVVLSQPEGAPAVEQVLINELVKGLDSEDIRVNPACVQVPVFFGESLSIQLELDKSVDVSAVRDCLSGVKDVALSVDAQEPTVESVAGSDQLMVGQIRTHSAFPGQLSLWLVADSARRAAINAIDMAEILLNDFSK